MTRSLICGLERSAADFNLNPDRLSNLSDTVIVLAGVRTLMQAIGLKRKGLFQRLLAGPNIVVFSDDYNSIIAAPDIDIVITPSDWVADVYLQDNPSLIGRTFAWPAGVDINYWAPQRGGVRESILIFDKRSEEDDPNRIEPYVGYLRALGFKVDVLLRGGTLEYTHGYYRSLLQSCMLMVGFTIGSESQGVAWAEAWAMDVPTLIQRNSVNIFRGRRYNCSTAPYLCAENGLFFDDFDDFRICFAFWQSNRECFSARAWTSRNLSDEVCAKLLYEKAVVC